MAHEELPWELIVEILSCVPPESLVRFRTVSKRWNVLFDDKTFPNNHKSMFQFILTTKSKIYSITINPKIVVRELTLDIPGLESLIPKRLVDCGEFLLCDMDNGAAVWNPWLNQSRVIKSQPGLHYEGIGYDGNKRKKNGYKPLASYKKELDPMAYWKIYDFATDAWKECKLNSSGRFSYLVTIGVPLNGNLYWVACHDMTVPLYHLHVWDGSTEIFFNLYDLPCSKNHRRDALVLNVFKGDRFSLLKQCYVTREIEIWVTKNKINNDDMVWMIFMEVSIPNLPDLVQTRSYSQPSYFIDDKRLIVCCCDENGRAWINVMGENKLISKTRIECIVERWPLHCTYFPSLAPVPQGPRVKPDKFNLIMFALLFVWLFKELPLIGFLVILFSNCFYIYFCKPDLWRKIISSY